MRRVFQNDVAREFGLQRWTMRLQFVDHASASVCAQSTDENMCALQIGRDIDIVDADQHAFEVYFARNDGAQLAFDELVYAELSMFHCSLKR